MGILQHPTLVHEGETLIPHLELIYYLLLKLHSSHLLIPLLEGYRELMGSLACARRVAAENISDGDAQTKYKYYDKHAKLVSYSIGEWILIRFPQDQSRKLSRPWHGPYWITVLTQTDVTAVKVYYP